MTSTASPPIATRRRLLGASAAALGAGLALPATAHAAPRPTRARYRLSQDFAVPKDTFGIVPWSTTVFQQGVDVALQPDGKVLIQTTGLYELVFSSDWDANSGNDIDLRKIGLRRQLPGQPDEPEQHERLGFMNMPGSNPPAMARYEGDWSPPRLAARAMTAIDVPVTPRGWVGAGDSAIASLSTISREHLDDQSLTAVTVVAKVIAPDTVRVTLYNPGVSPGIAVPPGTLRVVAMSGTRTHGSNGDGWMVLHTASVELNAGDRVYGLVEHKVPGTLLQATKSSYLQIDRL